MAESLDMTRLSAIFAPTVKMRHENTKDWRSDHRTEDPPALDPESLSANSQRWTGSDLRRIMIAQANCSGARQASSFPSRRTSSFRKRSEQERVASTARRGSLTRRLLCFLLSSGTRMGRVCALTHGSSGRDNCIGGGICAKVRWSVSSDLWACDDVSYPAQGPVAGGGCQDPRRISQERCR